jgi:hypothetical protein
MIGGVIGILSPVIMFLVSQLRKTDEKLSIKDSAHYKEKMDALKELMSKDIHALENGHQLNKEAIDSLSKEQYRLLNKVREYQNGSLGFYVIRDDYKEQMRRLEDRISKLESKP